MKGNKKHPPPIKPLASAAAPTSAAASPPPAASPTRIGTAKYTNKDGSRFITVPKPGASQLITPAVSSETPPPPSPFSPPPSDAMDAYAKTNPGPTLPGGNRKKAKRRAKAAAAREKAELESVPTQSAPPDDGAASAADVVSRQAHSPLSREAEGDGSSAYDEVHPLAAGAAPTPDMAAGKAKKAKKKKKKKDAQHTGEGHATAPTRPGEASSSKEKIWNTTSQEERHRIKEFWLDLSEEERKSLVKVEKDTVLKKMKEQQKLTCSCHFCGRKRTAIEEELEGLYDSYYEELEQFAHDPASHHGRGPPLMSSSAHFGSSRVLHSPAPASTYSGQHPSRGRIIEHMGDGEDDEDDEYCEDDDDDDDDLAPEDDESDADEEDIPPEELHRDYSSDFFNFGNSLQVHGGILTVADDLLKNDGRKFIEMMEQLAERRMAREEDAKDQYSNRGYISNGNGSAYGHNHHLPPEEDDYGVDEEEEEDYSQEEDYDEEEEAMTEEQRMEEGRRMFQIFAARMFEQRVLTAYREKVAEERQQKLLEELADEETQESQRKAKKAKDAQKRKDKLAQKKQALAEEKARKEAEKAAEEANRLAEENRKQEEQRRKAEEKRKKREAQRKAEEDERLRKELERQRRIHEQKERQAEQERKARDAKEREKKLKEESRQREREAQQKKDHAVREQAEKLERDRREKDATKPRPGEAREQRQKADNKAASKMAALLPTAVPTLPLIPAVPTPTAISTPAAPTAGISASAGTAPITLAKRPSQQQQLNAVPVLPQQPTVPQPGFSSPQIPIATPALPKAPTPGRTRQLSQHGGSSVGSQNGTASRTASLSGSSQSQNASPNPVTPVQTSPASFGHANAPSGVIHTTPGIMQNLVSGASPMLSSIKPVSTGQHQPTGVSLSMAPSPMPPLHYPLGMAPVTMPPGLGLSAPFAPVATGAYRVSGQPPMTPIPQGISSLSRSFSPMVAPPPGFGHHLPPVDQLRSASPVGPLSGAGASSSTAHSRHPSAGFDHPGSSPGPATHLLGRPHPIGRPGSVVHGSQRQAPGSPMDNLAHSVGSDMDSSNPFHLGSKALLEGSDFPMDDFPARRSIGLPRPGGFGAVPGPFTVDFAPSPFASQASLWGASSLPAPSAMAAFANAVPQGFPVGNVSAGSWGMPLNVGHFPSHGGLGRTSSQAHSVTLRQILCRACKELSATTATMDAHGTADPANSGSEATPEGDLIPIDAVKVRVNALAHNYIGPVQEAELDMLYDTEGNANNGGGNFDVQRNSEGKVTAICWVPDALPSRYKLGIGGEAISPAVGSSADFGTTPIGATPLRQ